MLYKALENNYLIEKKFDDNNKKKKKAKNDKNKENDTVNIKYGFCNMKLFDEFTNVSLLSLIELDYRKVIWDVNKQSKDEYISSENCIIQHFKNVFMVKFKWNLENCHLINSYEIANLLKNNMYNLIVIKIDYDKALVEFCCDDFNNEKDYSNIINILTEIKNNNLNINNQLIIDDVYPYENFNQQYLKLLS